MTKAYFFGLPLLAISLAHAQRPLTEAQEIEYSKSIDVKTLDPSLPSQRLEDWLQSGPPHTDSVHWLSDDTCDLKPDDSDSDYPRCVGISFRRGGQSGEFLVQIGTLYKGIIGPPHLYVGIGVQEPVFIQTGWTEQLSGLPKLLNQPVVAGGVNDFYQRIVQRHPIGIPTGADKTALWPFLSRRLIQKLETARACQADYLRQHLNADAVLKPAWLNTGIFVGNSKRASPLSANAVHKEPQKDGSFAVTVALTYVKLPGFVPDEANWVVVATVVPEDNRFVVDDVRLFDGLGTDGPSHLLTETLAGCDGTHWTGEHVTTEPPAPLPGPHYTDWDAVNALRGATYNEELAFAKAIDVHQLDSSLPSQRLGDWLNSLHVDHVTWEGLRCNIKEGGHGPRGEYLVTRSPAGGLCAAVWFQRGNARGSINVHTIGAGSSTAKVKSISVRDKDDGLLTTFSDSSDEVSDSNKLSDLPRLLNQQSVIDVTRNLYDAVVAHHPLGVPRGQDMVRIGPFLSKRLRQQLETARACRVDYLRQHPRPSNSREPGWFNTGLFSGDGKLALPTSTLVDQKDLREDGAFQVRVWLSRSDNPEPEPSAPVSQWTTWQVSALVKPEQGRFVVDDVRLFAGDTTDTPSRLLSDSFSGCDGPNWVGASGSAK